MKMAEWSIHAVCFDVIVEDEQRHRLFPLLLILSQLATKLNITLCSGEEHTLTSHMKYS